LNKWRGELTKGRNIQLPAVHVYSQRGARGVRGARGAVFRDIAHCSTRVLNLLLRYIAIMLRENASEERRWFVYITSMKSKE